MKKLLKRMWKWGIPVCITVLIALLSPIGMQIDSVPQATQTVGTEQFQVTFTVGTEAYAAGSADYTCDGTDDNVQIQAAIDALPANGGRVLILAGTYSISSSILVNDNYTILEGIGWATQLYAANSLDDDIVKVTGLWCRVAHLKFHGNKDNQASGSCLSIGATSGVTVHQYCTFEDLFLYEGKDAGLQLNPDTWDCAFSIIHTYNCGTGINIEKDESTYPASHTFTDVNIVGSDNDGVKTEGSWIYFNGIRIWTTQNGGNAAFYVAEGGTIGLVNGYIEDNAKHGILVKPNAGTGHLQTVRIISVSFHINGLDAEDTYDNIHLEGIDADPDQFVQKISIIGCTFNVGDCNSDIYMNAYVTNVNVTGNTGLSVMDFPNGSSNKYYLISDNPSYRTETRGFATITMGNTTVVVNHLLSCASAPHSPPLIFLSNSTESAMPAGTYVSNITSTQFTINIGAPQGADYTFVWRALSRLP